MPIGALEIAMILLITAGPLRALPYFHAATAVAEPALRRRIARRAALTTAIALLAFLLLGDGLLRMLHVGLPALEIAGGIILLTWSLAAISASGDPPEPATEPPAPGIGIHPIGLPMMASPQGMTAVVVVGATAKQTEDFLLITACVLGVALVNWAALHWARAIIGKVPAGVIQVLNRIVALLLAAMAIQVIVFGLMGLGIVDPSRAP